MKEKSAPRFTWIGYPDDLGVQNVGGRVGARVAPDAFLSVFQRMKGKWQLQSACSEFVMVPMGADIERNHLKAAQMTADCIPTGGKGNQQLNRQLIAVGGGHDYAYSWVKGMVEKLGSVAVINLDAHFDLRPFRPEMTSGSPFRRLIEENVLRPSQLFEFGIQSHCNAPELWDYVREKKIKTVPFEKLRNGTAVREFKKTLLAAKRSAKNVVISLDLDVLSFAYAPGVSAPQAEGLAASEVFQMLEIAGSDSKVASLGIFELSPPLDPQGLTVRCAAQAAWHYLDKALLRKGK